MALGTRFKNAFGNILTTLGDGSFVQAFTETYSDGAISEHFREVTGLTAGALNADLVPSTDVRHFSAFQLHIDATAFVGTLTFQGSNDNVNFVSVAVQDVAATATAPITSVTTGSRILVGAINYRYLRVRMTAYTSGSAHAVLELDRDTPTIMQQPGTAVTLTSTTINTSSSVNGAAVTSGNSAASTNATNLKASGGNIFSIIVNNTTAAAKFFKLYNKATAPTVGTDVPVATLTCPANATSVFVFADIGLPFTTGIGFGTTGAVTDADTTALAANDIKWTIQWR